MPNITIRNIPDVLYHDIKHFAQKDHRSINSEIIHGIFEYISRKKSAVTMIEEIKKIHENIDVNGFELSPKEMKKVIEQSRP
ncbi:MAG: Arc family DNA-binding protein [Deltaproteobacteria bacterium]|nr:Arc family DNA-binding protein [Candidatus Tharpella aukensis]